MPYNYKKTKYRRINSKPKPKPKKKKSIHACPRSIIDVKTYKACMRYVDTITLDASAVTVMDYNTFTCNGLYDPDITNIGHQPRGMDQLMLFFEHYTVVGAKLKATFINTSASEGDAQCSYVCVQQTAGPTPLYNTTNTILEKKSTKVIALMPHEAKTITSYVDLSKALGHDVMSDKKYSGTTLGNPEEQWYWQVMQGTNSGADPTSIQVKIEIEYATIFTEPRDIIGS